MGMGKKDERGEGRGREVANSILKRGVDFDL